MDADGDRRFRTVDKWHSDVTFRAKPSFGAALRARELPLIGGDTLWCDATAAYEGPSDEAKALIEGRTATHDLLYDFGDRIAPERREAMAAEFPPQHHPVVRTHPDTVERMLFVNASFTSRIDGMDGQKARRCFATCSISSRLPNTKCDFAGRPTQSRSGITARRSTTRSLTAGRPSAARSVSRLRATHRSDRST